jgi:flagellar basal body rod protein FlgG
MNYGMFLSTGGVLSASRRIDVLANNLANVNTTGFKRDFVVARERPAERIEGLSPRSDPMAPPQAILERLGGGIRFDRDRIDLSQGPLEKTGDSTDMAIAGKGFFVLAPEGNGPRGRGSAPTDLTRAGNMAIREDGTLINVDSGRALLGMDNRPVVVDPNVAFLIDRAGRVFQEQNEVGRFRIVEPTDVTTLVKRGNNVLRTTGDVRRVRDGDADVLQGFLEGSGADPVLSMVELTRQSRMLESNLRLMQYQDNITGQAIAGITRLS